MEFNTSGELTLADGHVFERGDIPRAPYRYMTSWLKSNFNPELNPDENWSRAEKAWLALTPEFKAQLFILSHKEVQSGDDIRQGLLATLASYQGVRLIKDLFETAIKSVEYKF